MRGKAEAPHGAVGLSAVFARKAQVIGCFWLRSLRTRISESSVINTPSDPKQTAFKNHGYCCSVTLMLTIGCCASTPRPMFCTRNNNSKNACHDRNIPPRAPRIAMRGFAPHLTSYVAEGTMTFSAPTSSTKRANRGSTCLLESQSISR